MLRRPVETAPQSRPLEYIPDREKPTLADLKVC